MIIQKFFDLKLRKWSLDKTQYYKLDTDLNINTFYFKIQLYGWFI